MALDYSNLYSSHPVGCQAPNRGPNPLVGLTQWGVGYQAPTPRGAPPQPAPNPAGFSQPTVSPNHVAVLYRSLPQLEYLEMLT